MGSQNMIQSTTRTFEILERLRDAGSVGVTALADDIGVSKSTVHNHLRTMEEQGYVIKEDGEYQLGLRFLSFPHSLLESNRLYQAAKPEVDEFVEKTDERCQVMVKEKDHGVYIYQATGTRSITTQSRVGTRVELHSTSIGKALLAHQPEEVVDRIIEETGLPAHTRNTFTDPDEFRAELEQVRNEGVAFDDEEGLLGLRCIAAPVRDSEGDSIGAISVSGPSTRINGEQFSEELPKQIKQTAQAIEIKYRYPNENTSV